MMSKLDIKRTSIVESATRVFSEKGFFESTISDIAKGSRMADSGVYKYFKGKEEILFTIPEEAMKIYLSNLDDQIEGIKGAENKLRKLIWYHCKYFTTNREYTHVLLLECRSNTRFYNSNAYKLIQDYSKIIIDIIGEGMREGIICELVSPGLLRDMIMGTIDHAALNWIFKNTPSPLDQAENISELILNSFRSNKSLGNKLDSKARKRKRIIEASTKIFAEKGYDGATISEIAKEAEVADGTIYEYYQSKENLIVSIPEENLVKLLSYIDETSPEKKLERMILFCFRFFNNNRYFTSILVLMLRPNRKFYKSESDKILGKICDKITEIIVKGREQGVFSKDFDILTFHDLVFGTIDHIIIPWVIFKRKYNLFQVGEKASRLFINAIRA
jgi:TetR/AcrR family fatty acid metabolism transcriptional regulator